MISDRTIIIPYSLKNRKTNDSLPISILNPLISSLSPSNKSKGARLVSIKESRNHNTNHNKINSQETRKKLTLKEDIKIMINIKDRIKATS